MRNPDEARRFFSFLFCSDLDGMVEVRVLPSARQLFFASPADAAAAATAPGNVHFGVCRRRGRAGGDDNIDYVEAVWAELDFKDFDRGRAGADDAVARAPRRPSLINASGHGYHCYWRLAEPHRVDEHTAGVIYGHARAIGADTRSTNIERLLRVPGTENLKDPEHPIAVETIYRNARALYDFDDFVEFYAERPQPPRPTGRHAVRLRADLGPPPQVFYNLLKNNHNLLALWQGDKRRGDTSRSGMDMSLAVALVRCGLSDQEIASVLQAYPHGKGRHMPIRYIEGTIGSARQWCS